MSWLLILVVSWVAWSLVEARIVWMIAADKATDAEQDRVRHAHAKRDRPAHRAPGPFPVDETAEALAMIELWKVPLEWPPDGCQPVFAGASEVGQLRSHRDQPYLPGVGSGIHGGCHTELTPRCTAAQGTELWNDVARARL